MFTIYFQMSRSRL